MGLVTQTPYVAGATVTASGQNTNEQAIVNEFNGNIENVNVKANAGIVASKLNLSSIAQTTAMSSAILKLAKGADVASVAGAITLGDDGNYFDITGTNAITSITAKTAGTVVTLQFDSTASLVDGSNLKLAGNFTGAAEAQITLSSDGTNWFEVSRNNTSAATSAAGNYLLEGYATGRNVLRKLSFQFAPGGTPGTNINISGQTGFNVNTVNNASNLGKNASSGSFALSTDGKDITLDTTEAILVCLSATIRQMKIMNGSTTASNIVFIDTSISSSNMVINVVNYSSLSKEDFTAVLSTSGDLLFVDFLILTST